jgi:hypothetical protein
LIVFFLGRVSYRLRIKYFFGFSFFSKIVFSMMRAILVLAWVVLHSVGAYACTPQTFTAKLGPKGYQDFICFSSSAIPGSSFPLSVQATVTSANNDQYTMSYFSSSLSNCVALSVSQMQCHHDIKIYGQGDNLPQTAKFQVPHCSANLNAAESSGLLFTCNNNNQNCQLSVSTCADAAAPVVAPGGAGTTSTDSSTDSGTSGSANNVIISACVIAGLVLGSIFLVLYCVRQRRKKRALQAKAAAELAALQQYAAMQAFAAQSAAAQANAAAAAEVNIKMKNETPKLKRAQRRQDSESESD